MIERDGAAAVAKMAVVVDGRGDGWQRARLSGNARERAGCTASASVVLALAWPRA